MGFKIPLIKKRTIVFENTKEMKLWHYSKYLDTNDLRYFSNYFDIKNPKEPNKKDLEASMAKIFGLILEQTQDFEVIEKFNNTHKVYKLQIKYKDVKRLISVLRMHDIRLGMEIFNKLVAQLEQWGYKISRKKDIFTQLDKIERRLEGLKSEIESLLKKLRKSQKTEKAEIEEKIFNIEQGLDMKYPIDMKTTSLFKWVLMQQKLENKIELLNRSNAK